VVFILVQVEALAIKVGVHDWCTHHSSLNSLMTQTFAYLRRV